MTFTPAEVRTLAAWARFVQSLSPGPPYAGFLLFHDTKGRLTVAETIVGADQGTVTARVRFLDAHGNETAPDDTPAWSSSDESVATVEPGADGLTATVTVTGKAGASVVGVETVEANTGDTIRAEGTLTVQASDTTVSGEVNFDTATPT